MLGEEYGEEMCIQSRDGEGICKLAKVHCVLLVKATERVMAFHFFTQGLDLVTTDGNIACLQSLEISNLNSVIDYF